MCDVAQNLHNASVLRLDGQALQLILQLAGHALGPTADLVIDKLHVLFAVVEAFKLSCQILFLSLQVGILGLLGLGVILGVHKHLHLCIVGLFLLLVVHGRLADLTPILVGDLELTHSFCLFAIELLQLVVSLLICLDGEE